MTRLLRLASAVGLRCGHARLTFPMTPVSKFGAKGTTYVACLDCGLEFRYDWDAMRVGKPIPDAEPDAGVSQEIMG